MKHVKQLFRKKPFEDVQIRGDPPSTLRPSEAFTGQNEVAVNALDVAIQLIQQVGDLMPIALAKNILMGINSILLLIQKYIKNKLDLTGLAQICKDICSTLAQAMKGVSMDQLSDAVRDALNALNSSIKQLHSKVKKAMQHGHARRVAGASLDQNTISNWTGDLDQIQRSFGTKVNIVSAIRLDQIFHVLKHPEIRTLIPEPPPPSPAFFFGRERLFADVKDILLSDKDVALIGPGGIGKSSIAKALINDEDIQKCYGRRFFVSYDGMDPATITTGSFVDRIASVLGLSALGVEGKSQVISNLSSSPVLIVLDNAETFEDAANADATDQIATIVSHIANTRGVTVILTSRTRRSARDADWTEIHVPPLEKAPARQYFRQIYHGDIADEDIDELLTALDFHPLSIHILAFAARESQWTGKELLDEWQAQRIKLLQTGRKKENLAFTIQLSLRSPSVKELGDDALNVLRLIAFFPQGINRDHATRLFPSIPNVSSLLGTLLRVSLAYRSDTFMTTLAPIRLYLLDEFPTRTIGLELLDDIRRLYYDSLQTISKEKDFHANLLVSDHLNMEHLIMHDIENALDNNLDAIRACCCFLVGLRYHKLRPTLLAPIISSFPEGSNSEKDMKARCLFALGELCSELSNYVSAVTAHLAASALYVAVGNHSMAAVTASNAAMHNNNQGYDARAQQLLEDFIRSPSWQHTDEWDKGEIQFTLDFSKMHTSAESTDKLFVQSMDHGFRGLDSRISHWVARMNHGYNTPEETQRNIEPLRSGCISSSSVGDRWAFFEGMAEVAFAQRRYDVAMELLKEAYDAVDGNLLFTLVVLYHQAAVATVQGNYEFARSLLQHVLDTLGVVATPSSSEFWGMCYVQGRNELYAGNYPKARQFFIDLVADYGAQVDIGTKMECTRALGEMELLLHNQTDSDRYFAATVDWCREAGVPPELMGVCTPILKLDDDKFPGWRTFIRARAG